MHSKVTNEIIRNECGRATLLLTLWNCLRDLYGTLLITARKLKKINFLFRLKHIYKKNHSLCHLDGNGLWVSFNGIYSELASCNHVLLNEVFNNCIYYICKTSAHLSRNQCLILDNFKVQLLIHKPRFKLKAFWIFRRLFTQNFKKKTVIWLNNFHHIHTHT